MWVFIWSFLFVMNVLLMIGNALTAGEADLVILNFVLATASVVFLLETINNERPK